MPHSSTVVILEFIDWAKRFLTTKEISHVPDWTVGDHTSSMKDTAVFATMMKASVTRQS